MSNFIINTINLLRGIATEEDLEKILNETESAFIRTFKYDFNFKTLRASILERSREITKYADKKLQSWQCKKNLMVAIENNAHYSNMREVADLDKLFEEILLDYDNQTLEEHKQNSAILIRWISSSYYLTFLKVLYEKFYKKDSELRYIEQYETINDFLASLLIKRVLMISIDKDDLDKSWPLYEVMNSYPMELLNKVIDDISSELTVFRQDILENRKPNLEKITDIVKEWDQCISNIKKLNQ